MKIASKILSVVILLSCVMLYSACDNGGGDGKSETEQQFDKLKAFTWEFASATLDGDDRSADFPGLTMTIGGTFVPETGVYNYSFGGTLPAERSPWPRTGQWIFGTNPLSEIIRDPDTVDEIVTDYVVTESSLVLTFIIPPTNDGWDGSRGKAVSGEWVFTFTN